MSGLSSSDLWSSCGRSCCGISAGAVVCAGGEVARAAVTAGFERVVDAAFAVVTACFDVCAVVVAVVVCVLEICVSGTDFSVVIEVPTVVTEVV